MSPRHPRYPVDPALRREDGALYTQRLSRECRERRSVAARDRVSPTQHTVLRELAQGHPLEPVPGARGRRWQLRRLDDELALRPVPMLAVRSLVRRGWLCLRGTLVSGGAAITEAGRERLARLEAELRERARLAAERSAESTTTPTEAAA